MVKRNPSLQEIKQAIRDKYAWPGGYPLFFITGQGDALSILGAKEIWRDIIQSYNHHRHCDSSIESIEINYEDPSLYCCVTNQRIESAYAEDEALKD
jgi:hypothetical protein